MQSRASSIRSLAHRISSLAEALAAHLDNETSPSSAPSDSVPAAQTDDEEAAHGTDAYERLRTSLCQPLSDLAALVTSPEKHIRSFTCSHYDLAAYQVALEFGMFRAIPLSPEGSTATLAEIARAIGLDEDRTGRVLRMLVTRGFFEEVGVGPGTFAHSPASKLLASDGDVHAAAGMQ